MSSIGRAVRTPRVAPTTVVITWKEFSRITEVTAASGWQGGNSAQRASHKRVNLVPVGRALRGASQSGKRWNSIRMRPQLEMQLLPAKVDVPGSSPVSPSNSLVRTRPRRRQPEGRRVTGSAIRFAYGSTSLRSNAEHRTMTIHQVGRTGRRLRRRDMPRDCVTTAAAPKSPAYSQAVKAAGLVFVSGQAGFDPATGKLAGTTIQEQTRQCLKNVSAVLDAAGSSLNNIVSATFILRDPEDFAGMNEEWRRGFRRTRPPGKVPNSRSTSLLVSVCRSPLSQRLEEAPVCRTSTIRSGEVPMMQLSNAAWRSLDSARPLVTEGTRCVGRFEWSGIWP